MPAAGLGLWKIEKEQTAATVTEAIAAGYRHSGQRRRLRQ